MATTPRIHHTRSGSGPPLLLVQGVAATHRHWGARLLRALTYHFDVVAFDHRGTGASVDLGDDLRVEDMADDAAVVMDDVGWDHATVFGVSLGGLVAQEMTLRHPRRVERLVLGCTSTGGTALDDSGADAAIHAAVVPGDPVATARRLFAVGVRAPTETEPDAWEEYRQATVGAPVSSRTTVLQNHAHRQHSTHGRLGGVAVPTLVLHGDTDRLVPIDRGRALARQIDGARFVPLSAGHFFWLEHPDLVTHLLRGFGSDHPAHPGPRAGRRYRHADVDRPGAEVRGPGPVQEVQ